MKKKLRHSKTNNPLGQIRYTNSKIRNINQHKHNVIFSLELKLTC